MKMKKNCRSESYRNRLNKWNTSKFDFHSVEISQSPDIKQYQNKRLWDKNGQTVWMKSDLAIRTSIRKVFWCKPILFLEGWFSQIAIYLLLT